jgi:TrmH family RNA methyltransferase
VISSRTNSTVKYVCSLHRRAVRHREQRFLVEGVRLTEEMMKAGREPVFLFYTEAISRQPRAQAFLDAARSSAAEVVAVSEDVMRVMSDTKTPQGILAVAEFPRVDAVESSLSLVLDGVRDPGNLGTILRTAEAAGVGVVLTLRGTVDVYSPKVVRGAMGAHFRLPVRADCTWEDAQGAARQRQVLLADPRGGKPYYQVDWTLPTTLVVGGEAQGASAEARALATTLVTIPMKGSAESLNAAVATSILLFEAARQRGGSSTAV